MMIVSNFLLEKTEPREAPVPFGLHSCGCYSLPRGNILTDLHRNGPVF